MENEIKSLISEFKEAHCLGEAKEVIGKVGGQIREFILGDKGFREEFDKANCVESFEEVTDSFINYLFENAHNPRIQYYYVKNGDQTLQLMDMEDALKLFIHFVNNDAEELDKLDKSRQIGELAIKMKEAEKKRDVMLANPIDIKDVDLIKYHKLYFSKELVEKGNFKGGEIIMLDSPVVYDEEKNGIKVKGEVKIVYLGQENMHAITYDFFNHVMSMKDKILDKGNKE